MASRSMTGGIALLLIIGLLAGCSRGDATAPTPAATPEPLAVRVAVAAHGSIAATLTYPGNVQSRAQVPVVPEVAGRIKHLAVDLGDEVKAGDVIAELDAAAYDLQLAQTEAMLAAAEAKVAAMEAGSRPEQVALAAANLQAARGRLSGMQEGGRAEMVAQAEANLAAAEARLEQARKGATPEQLEQIEAQVRLAHNNEYYQQQQADTLGRIISQLPGDADSGGLRHAQLGIAWEQSKIAEAKLAEVRAGATPEQLKQLEAAVEAARQQVMMAQNPFTSHDLGQAEAAVKVAEQQYALAEQPFTANELNAARASVDQARTAVDLAKLQRQKATITAPFDGLVAQRLASEGAMAGPTTPLVMLIAREVEVTVSVEEARLGRLRLGQPATLTVAAYPGERFAAEVAAIAPAVDPRSRTVAVKIRPRSADNLREGMFAQVSIVTGEQADALLVPTAAVIDRNGRKVAFVVDDGILKLREVKVGLTDGAMIEITEGLAAGEDVIVEGVDGLTPGQAVTALR